jgi:two-component system, response regulator
METSKLKGKMEGEILLAEDTESDAYLTIRAIRRNKIDNAIIHVDDGKDAIDFLFGQGKFTGRDITKKPKFILLDLKMPKLIGIDVLKLIKDNVQTKKIPVVILTSSREDPDIDQCYSLGVNSYIVKPLLYADFEKTESDLGLYWTAHNEPSN